MPENFRGYPQRVSNLQYFTRNLLNRRVLPDNSFRCPGLTPGYQEVKKVAFQISKSAAAYLFRRHDPLLWVVFIGGTGTGKSTLFNAFCGTPISAVGVERPKTQGAILYVHEKDIENHELGKTSSKIDEDKWSEKPLEGMPTVLTVVKHRNDRLRRLVVCDTPDIDSVTLENREIAEDLYLLADIVVFVASQEKYADDVPYQFLKRVLKEEKPYFVLLNKATLSLLPGEVTGLLREQGINVDPKRLWLVPYLPVPQVARGLENTGFRDFIDSFFDEVRPERISDLRHRQQKRSASCLLSEIDNLLRLLGEEDQASKRWLRMLDQTFDSICKELLEEERLRFSKESQRYIQVEIKRLFSRYDFLAGPRRIITGILSVPLRTLGVKMSRAASDRRRLLDEILEELDPSPILGTVERFNRMVLEQLSPSDVSAPLFSALRREETVLTPEMIKERLYQQRKSLAGWLEDTFQKFAQGISREKRIGMYSTSILWGILIIVLETVIGGGFSFVDAVVDSALAPFLTKGAVELFAYREIQRIARELSSRYEEGLVSTIREQRNRFARCLESLQIPEEAIEKLKDLRRLVERESA